MSPRTKKTDPDPDTSADPQDATPDTSGDEAGEAPKKKRSPRASTAKSKAKTKAKANEDASADAGDDAGPDAETTPDADANPKRGGRTKKAADDGDANDADAADAGASDGNAADAGERDGSTDGDANEGNEARGNEKRGKRRGRRSRGGGGGGGNAPKVTFRDLQAKILPELHLMAKEAGLEAYRDMEKDALVLAVLERYAENEGLKLVQGYLEISSDGYGFLQASMLQTGSRKVIVSAGLIKQFKLRTGDWVLGKARAPRNNERYGSLVRVEAVNGVDPFQASKRPRFDDLVPTFPEQRIALETTPDALSSRVIDLLAPIGRGQRGLIVAPPKAGKTTLLKAIAHSVAVNEPDVTLIVLLVDERPEEVTDFRESVEGVEVVASTFDEPPANHIRVAEFVHERARRIVEDGGHVMVLLDSITRLARANNLVTPPTGRTLSGGLDSSALHWPKRFLGAARNIRGGGSLSILATALVETGSRMDDVIFEEFKGTGNMELHLSRRLEERRIFPAIDILKSGTRREDLLLDEAVLAKMWLLRKVISDMDPAEAMEMLLSRLSRTDTNEAFLATLGQG